MAVTPFSLAALRAAAADLMQQEPVSSPEARPHYEAIRDWAQRGLGEAPAAPLPPDAKYSRYLDVVRGAVASEEAFSIFKGHPDYREVLEHVSEAQGWAYLDAIRSHAVVMPAAAWEAIAANDIIGTPARAHFELPIGGRFVSPTTLRYVKFSLDVIEHMRRCGMTEPVSIVEIGPGYSGFCTVFMAVRKALDIAVCAYTMLDLADVAALCNKVQARLAPWGFWYGVHSTRAVTLAGFDEWHPTPAALVLSFYCYSELGPEWRATYRDAIVSKAPHGFMAWNDIPRESIAAELGRTDFDVVPEVPLTGPCNCIVRW